MSMNLAFRDKSTGDLVDFPYQTTTAVMCAVMDASNNSERLNIIRDDLWTRYTKEYNWMIREVAEMLNDDSLELTYI